MTTIKRIFFYLGILIGGGIFGWQVINSIQSLIQKKIALNFPILLLISFVGLLIYVGTQITDWQIILSGLGKKIDWKFIARGYPLASVSRYIPGTVWGYISRSEWIYREQGVAYRISGAASLIEIGVSFTSAFIMLGLISIVNQPFKENNWLWGSFLIPVLVWLIFERLKNTEQIRLFKLKIPNPILQIPLRTWGISHAICLAQWLIYGVCIWLLVHAVYGPSAALASSSSIYYEIAGGTFAYALAWTIGFIIPFIPGGIGIREVLLTFYLPFFFNIDSSQAAVIAILLRIMYSIAELIWMGWGIAQPRRKE